MRPEVHDRRRVDSQFQCLARHTAAGSRTRQSQPVNRQKLCWPSCRNLCMPWPALELEIKPPCSGHDQFAVLVAPSGIAAHSSTWPRPSLASRHAPLRIPLYTASPFSTTTSAQLCPQMPIHVLWPNGSACFSVCQFANHAQQNPHALAPSEHIIELAVGRSRNVDAWDEDNAYRPDVCCGTEKTCG
ncbi:hypothetical protein P154DRAFT_27690 [Amniculicola lignicola CBS 123094]|uniref:Uncharacterized protein n=1 Tax=Amniculicola lignicola CBS 123094 TaxID=1392246 RepID=A0A6A5W366_9PLEO|nr:hypothetical protein P154DRAFT_27690 [Amniculicola lignicola CBS 123094]